MKDIVSLIFLSFEFFFFLGFPRPSRPEPGAAHRLDVQVCERELRPVGGGRVGGRPESPGPDHWPRLRPLPRLRPVCVYPGAAERGGPDPAPHLLQVCQVMLFVAETLCRKFFSVIRKRVFEHIYHC